MATSLWVEVSFDDGQTWQPAPVLGNRFVRIRHPRQEGLVSLRATAANADGSTINVEDVPSFRGYIPHVVAPTIAAVSRWGGAAGAAVGPRVAILRAHDP